MGGHKRYRRWVRTDHAHDDYFGPDRSGYPLDGSPDPRMPPPRPIPRIFVVVALAVWSVLAWIGYVSVDIVVGWAAVLADFALTSAKDLAAAIGVGKEVGGVADSFKATGLLDQAFALLRWIAKPAIVVIWAVGALAIVAAPAILSRIRGQFTGRWH